MIHYYSFYSAEFLRPFGPVNTPDLHITNGCFSSLGNRELADFR